MVFSEPFYDNGWKLIKKEGNFEVFSRDSDRSTAKEIRITLTVKSTVEKVAEVLNDVSQYTFWVYKCKDAKRIKTIHENEFYYYVVSDFPFPFSDRDLVVHNKHWIDEETGIYYSQSRASPEMMEENEDYIRINEFSSFWKISPIKENIFHIDYQVKTSPGGDIPMWMVNFAIAFGPIATMTKFTELVEIKEIVN